MELHPASRQPAARAGELQGLIWLSAARSLRMPPTGSCMIIHMLDVHQGPAGPSAATAKMIHEYSCP
jgi:hypothetical protein